MGKQAFYTPPGTALRASAQAKQRTQVPPKKPHRKKPPVSPTRSGRKRAWTTHAFLVGIVLAGAGILASAAEPLKFLNLTGLIIVLGGIAAAVFASYPVKEVKRAYAEAKAARQEPPNSDHKYIEQLFLFTVLLRRNNLHAAEQVIDGIPNTHMKAGLQGLLDRESPAEIQHLLSWRMNQFRAERMSAVKIFQSMAVYAPAFGMVGTLVGLVNMMLVIEQKSFDLVSANLGIALVTTFYGLLLANLVFKPIAIKLERQIEHQLNTMRLISKGIMLIADGKSPALVRDQLLSLCTQPAPPDSPAQITSKEALSAIEQVMQPVRRSHTTPRPILRSAS